MTQLQRFKDNDLTEAKVIDTAMPVLEGIGEDLNSFYDNAFTSAFLGDVIYELKRDPMTSALTQDVYRASFFAIHELFTQPGVFEFYLTVFRAIWGEDVAIVFAIPSPGVLTINADVLDIDEFLLTAREVVLSEYVFHQIVDHDSDNIEVKDTIGIKTQSEVNALMNELTPEGVFVTVSLTI